MTEKRRVRLGTVSRDVVPSAAARSRSTARAGRPLPTARRLATSRRRQGRWTRVRRGPAESPWIFFDGHVYHLEVTAAETAARPRRDAAGELSAPMPATVRAVLVSVGDHVTGGQPLVILEAMKMELPLRAPVEGTVQSVRCEPGDLVQPGTPLVEVA